MDTHTCTHTCTRTRSHAHAHAHAHTHAPAHTHTHTPQKVNLCGSVSGVALSLKHTFLFLDLREAYMWHTLYTHRWTNDTPHILVEEFMEKE